MSLANLVKIITKNPKGFKNFSQSPNDMRTFLKKAKINAPQSLEKASKEFDKKVLKASDRELIDMDFFNPEDYVDIEESITDLVIAIQNKINKKVPKKVEDLFIHLNDKDKDMLYDIINDPSIDSKTFEKLIEDLTEGVELEILYKEFFKPQFLNIERNKPTLKNLKATNEKKVGGSIIERNPYE